MAEKKPFSGNTLRCIRQNGGVKWVCAQGGEDAQIVAAKSTNAGSVKPTEIREHEKMRSKNRNDEHQTNGTTAKRSVRSRRVSKFNNHVKAHTTVIGNEAWYGDDPPELGQQFTAKRTAERCQMLIRILLRAAKRSRKIGDKELARNYHDVAKKLKACRPKGRCGSLACPLCARAFQKAKVAAQETLISDLKRSKSTKKLVMASVVPLAMTFKPEQLAGLDIRKRNRWLKDVLRGAGFDRVMFGSADISWENGYYQLHWHIGMWTATAEEADSQADETVPRQGALRPPSISEQDPRSRISRVHEQGHQPARSAATESASFGRIATGACADRALGPHRCHEVAVEHGNVWVSTKADQCMNADRSCCVFPPCAFDRATASKNATPSCWRASGRSWRIVVSFRLASSAS